LKKDQYHYIIIPKIFLKEEARDQKFQNSKRNGDNIMLKQQGKRAFARKVSDWFQKEFSRMLWIVFFMILMFTMAARYSYAAEMPKPVNNFEAYVFHDSQGGTLPYRLLKPMTENTVKLTKYPLVLYLHGTGERGSDNIKQLKYTDIFGKSAFRQKYPSFVVIPQCPARENWVEKESYSGTIRQSPKPAKPLWQTIELLRELQNQFPIDPDRIYVIGISSGGSGVWDLVARYPHMFAAASPICGSGDDQKADLMINTPIWAFHGGRDILVNPNTTRKMIKAIQKAGGHPKYTEYPNMFHTVWNKTFHDPQFFQWLFEQKRYGKR
jgi:predicted peptidase